MNNKIHLSKNHTRTLSSSLIIVEKSLSELEGLLVSQNKSCCSEILKDIDDSTITYNLDVINEAKRFICALAGKYGTSKEKLSLQRIINAKRAKIWEILSDTLSRKIKCYGAFPERYAEEFDADINKLIEITNRIKYL